MNATLASPECQFFEDPLAHIEPIKAMNWMYELFCLYREAITEDDLNESFGMVCSIATRFADYIGIQKFVTMKQTEL